MTASTSSMLAELRPVLANLRTESASLISAVQVALPLDSNMLETGQGPSLLTLKNAALLNYLHHLVLLSAARLRGRPLESKHAGKDGADAAGLVRNLIELRLVLEKIRPVEGRMRGLVERLARAADEDDKRIREGRVEEEDNVTGQALGRSTSSADEEVDPLAFRPNVAALSAATAGSLNDSRGGRPRQDGKQSRERGGEDGVYRPPRLAPVVYNPEQTTTTTGRAGKKERVAPRNAALLSDLTASMSGNPYEVSSAGVGVGGSGGAGGHAASSRAKALSRMQQYEEDNFTRLTMSKRNANRRRRDEADVALGGAGMSNKRGRVGAGLEEEFGDLLRNRSSSGDLRGGRRSSALQRSRTTGESGNGVDAFGSDTGGGGGGGGGGGKFQKKMRRDSRKRGGDAKKR